MIIQWISGACLSEKHRMPILFGHNAARKTNSYHYITIIHYGIAMLSLDGAKERKCGFWEVIPVKHKLIREEAIGYWRGIEHTSLNLIMP